MGQCAGSDLTRAPAPTCCETDGEWRSTSIPASRRWTSPRSRNWTRSSAWSPRGRLHRRRRTGASQEARQSIWRYLVVRRGRGAGGREPDQRAPCRSELSARNDGRRDSTDPVRRGLARLRRRWFLFVWLQCAHAVAARDRGRHRGRGRDPRPRAACRACRSSHWRLPSPLLSLAALAVLSWRWWQRPSDLPGRAIRRGAVSRTGRAVDQRRGRAGARTRRVPCTSSCSRGRAHSRATGRRPRGAVACAGATGRGDGRRPRCGTRGSDHVRPPRTACMADRAGLVLPVDRSRWSSQPGDARVVEGGVVPLRVRIDGRPPRGVERARHGRRDGAAPPGGARAAVCRWRVRRRPARGRALLQLPRRQRRAWPRPSTA